MDRKAPRVADVGDMVEKLQRIDEALTRRAAAGQFESDQPAKAAFEVTLGPPTKDSGFVEG